VNILEKEVDMKTAKEIQERITNLSNNLHLIQDEQAKERFKQEIELLIKFKDKSEGEIICNITNDKSLKDLTVKWILGKVV
jgi:formiminotetrahydrofolate cyclodeaminase